MQEFLLDELPMYIQRPILAALARGIRVLSDVLEHIAADVAASGDAYYPKLTVE